MALPDAALPGTALHIHFDGRDFNAACHGGAEMILNGRRKVTARLSDGDRIRLGSTELRFTLRDLAAAPPRRRARPPGGHGGAGPLLRAAPGGARHDPPARRAARRPARGHPRREGLPHPVRGGPHGGEGGAQPGPRDHRRRGGAHLRLHRAAGDVEPAAGDRGRRAARHPLVGLLVGGEPQALLGAVRAAAPPGVAAGRHLPRQRQRGEPLRAARPGGAHRLRGAGVAAGGERAPPARAAARERGAARGGPAAAVRRAGGRRRQHARGLPAHRAGGPHRRGGAGVGRAGDRQVSWWPARSTGGRPGPRGPS